ncbi:MAG: membrane protein insertase YidC [Gammaproteobacteria bacterium]|nr:membrane protein insertase YidC [Gammaproteobacteria bacterium]
MDNIRLILIFSLAFIVLMLWQAWNEDYGPKAPVVTQAGGQQTPPPGEGELAPSVPLAPVAASTDPGMVTTSEGTGSAPSKGQTVFVETDLYSMEIDSQGGNIKSVHLKQYPVSLEQPDVKFQLLRSSPPNLFVAQSGLISSSAETAPTHEALYHAKQQTYSMDAADSLKVELFWKGETGVQVTKRYYFSRGSYLVTVEHLVENGSTSNWDGREYRQLIRSQPAENSGDSQFLYTYTGGAIYSPDEKYEKIKFEDMEEKPLSRDVSGGWISMLQHYFLGAWIPPAGEVEHFYTNVLPDKRYVLGAYTQPVSVAPGNSHIFKTGFVAGPKLQDELEAIAPGLELTADYGWLTVLAKPIFWLLKAIHEVIGNWGWSIIILTLIIKLAFFKLSETSYKSMANMRKMTPRIQALKDRYGDDKQRMNQAMMELYKKEKINPLGGCLPILVQIPVFIALYWVLLESVELRQAPFVLWIKDLSLKDPFFVLPVIMGISMFIQQKLNPAPPDPMQAKIMMSLPFVFTVFFAFFPSGLVLYWVTNNILSIAQQWYITRQIEKAG